MRLLDRMLGRTAERAVTPSTFANSLGFMFGNPDAERVAPTIQNAIEAFSGNSIVFGVEQSRISLFTEAEFKFRRLSDKGLFGNEDLGLLENPWPNGTTGDLLAWMMLWADLAGNAYVRWVKALDRLEWLDPQYVTIISELVDDGQDGQVRECLGFYYDPPANWHREPDFYPVDEVAHWAPTPDPSATFRGMSWLTPVLRDIAADSEMTEYKRAYLSNAATPNLIIKYATELKQDQRDRLAEQVRARHGGVGNAFKTMVLDAGADPMIVGNTFEAMAFQAVQSAGENRIAVAAGVPAIVAGLSEGLDSSAYGVYAFAMRRFTDITMRPLWRTACASLAKFVNVPAGARLWFDVEDVAALRQGEKDSADTMQVLAQAAQAFVNAGFVPESITKALSASDVNLLAHSGLVSVQLQPPGAEQPAGRSSVEEMTDLVRAGTPSELHIHQAPTQVDNHVQVPNAVVRNEFTVPVPVVNVETAPTEVRVEAAQPAVVNVTNQVEAPMVNVTNEVQPADVVVVQPKRTATTTAVTRDRKGDITGSTATTEVVE